MAKSARFVYFFSLAFFALAVPSGICGAETKYLSQTYIDTTIQRALYILTENSQIQLRGHNMESAIGQAKEIALRLKKEAKGDPNERYILYRINELEQHIYLEESGFMQAKSQKSTVSVNKLLQQYNTELAKRRPNFAALKGIQKEIRAIDPNKAAEVEESVDSRSKSITNEIINTVESALTSGNFNSARMDLVYAKTNLDHLHISLAQYSQLAAKLQARTTLDEELAFVDSSFANIDKLLGAASIEDARQRVDFISQRLIALREVTLPRIWDKYYYKNKKMSAAVDHKEDSLVRVNFDILNKKGILDADDYLNKVCKAKGVSHEKIMAVDNAILKAAVQQDDEDTTISSEVASLSPWQSSTSILDDLRMGAKVHAQQRQDSIEAATRTMGSVTQLDEVRRANLQLVQQGRLTREEQRQKELAEQAQKCMIEILTLIEKKKIADARHRFAQEKNLLKKYLGADAFISLDTIVAKPGSR
jgi:hypothetical protein